MAVPSVHVPNDAAELIKLSEWQGTVGNPQLRQAWTDELAGAYLPKLMGRLGGRAENGNVVRGICDDNRSVLLTDRRFVIGEREYFTSIKGCGAQFDAFTHQHLDEGILKDICRDPALAEKLTAGASGATRFITGERWYGKSPYGAQAPDNALLALLASLRANVNQIAGFHICPIIAVVRLPEEAERIASKFFWYRKYEGGYWQEFRLMPSNIRLYFQSPVTFGMNTDLAFSMFHLDSMQACERFLANLSRSSMAALTLFARSLRHDPKHGRYLGLEFQDVWLDKDAVIAPDGVLHFADLEGLEDEPATTVEQVKERIRAQFFKHVYEVNFALEALAVQTDRMLALRRSHDERRDWLMDVMESASRSDGYVKLERRGGKMMAIVEPAVDADRLTVEMELFSEVGN
jgi:hypothetical protein